MGPWLVEYDEEGGICVVNDDDRAAITQSVLPVDLHGHPSELAAWEYGLECLLERRIYLARHIKEARRQIRQRKLRQ